MYTVSVRVLVAGPRVGLCELRAATGTLLVACVCCAAISGSGHAAVIASWNMVGQNGSQATTIGTGPSQVGNVTMERGRGLSGYEKSDSMNTRGWDSESADDYIEFGFTVDAGWAVQLEKLLIGTRSSATGPGTLGLYTSVDGFANSIATLIEPADLDTNEYLSSEISLTGLPEVTGSFRVRIIEIGNLQADGVGTTASTGTFRVARTPPLPVKQPRTSKVSSEPSHQLYPNPRHS